MHESERTAAVSLRGLFLALVVIAVWASQAIVPANAAGVAAAMPQKTRTVALQITGFHKGWARRGFNEPQLYAEVETWLQTAGYRVVTPATMKNHADVDLLSLELHVNHTVYNWSYLVFLKLKVKMPVPVNREGFVTRTVWSDWRIGGVELDHPGRLHAPIFDLLREFASRP